MSEFIDLYREKNRIKAQMRRIRKRSDPDKYWELDKKQKAINERLNQIIADDNASRTKAGSS